MSYSAFGHIHRPQELPGGGGRYAGSPLQLDFGEEGETKEVVLIEATPVWPHTSTRFRCSLADGLYPLSGTLDQLPELCEPVGLSLCRVVVQTEQPTPDLAERVRELLPQATILDVVEDCAATRVEPLTRSATEQSAEESLADLFHEYLSGRTARERVPTGC